MLQTRGGRLLSIEIPSEVTLAQRRGWADNTLWADNAYFTVFGRNFPAALLMVGAEHLSVHYEAIYAQGGKVPAAIAHGNVSLGKSMSTEAALSLLGVHEKTK